MTCDDCGKEAVAFYGEKRTTGNGTHLVSRKHFCYECYCERYGEAEDADTTQKV